MTGKVSRYDFDRLGKRFVIQLISAIGLLVVSWIILHAAKPPESIFPKASEFYILEKAQTEDCQPNSGCGDALGLYDATGILILKNPQKAQFFLGESQVEFFQEGIKQGNTAIYDLKRDIQTQLMAFKEALGNDESLNHVSIKLRQELEAAGYHRLPKIWYDFEQSLSPAEYKAIQEPREVLVDSFYKLLQTRRIQFEAYQDLNVPPFLARIFWVDGYWLLLETLFWSLLGVLVQLLVRSVKFLTDSNFQPRQRYVAFTKAVYGPILSMFFCMAILIGWIDIGSYEVIAWSMPLMAFVFGYNSRKIADLFNTFSQRFLGQVEKGIEAGPEKARKRQRDWLNRVRNEARPSNFKELKEDAVELAKAYTKNFVEHKESQR